MSETPEMVRARLTTLLAEASPRDAPAIARLLLEMDAAESAEKAAADGDALDQLAKAREQRNATTAKGRTRQQKRFSS